MILAIDCSANLCAACVYDDGAGKELGSFKVEKVQSAGPKNKTCTVWLIVPRELAMDVRGIRLGGEKHA